MVDVKIAETLKRSRGSENVITVLKIGDLSSMKTQSKKIGIGMTEHDDRFSDAVLWKARYAVNSGRVAADDQYDDVYWVERSSGGKFYRVKLSEKFQTCTCPNGMNLGSTPLCYHVAAALMMESGEVHRGANL